MADTQVWEAIATLRSLLELVPDTPGGACRLDTCIAWVRQVVEFETYTPPAAKLATAGDTAAKDEQLIDGYLAAVEESSGDPPPVPQDGATGARPKFTGVPFPHEPDARDGSLWHTERPWQAINGTLARLRGVMPSLLASVSMDPTLKDRITRESKSEGGFLEEDMRGTIWGFLGSDKPVDEKMRARNNGRLDALAVFLGAIRAKPEVVLEAADAILQQAKAALTGWAFDVSGGVVGHHGIITPDLSPEVVFFLKSVVDASPEYVNFKAFPKLAAAAGVKVESTKLDAIKRQLPKHLLDLLEFAPGVGTRLKPKSGGSS